MDENCNECKFQPLLVEMQKNYDEKLKLYDSRLRDVERSTDGMVKDIKYFRDTVNDIKAMIERMTVQLDIIRGNPGKRWDSLIQILMAAVVGGVVGHFFK